MKLVVPQPILVALDPALWAIIETGYARSADPSKQVRFGLLPPVSAWGPDAKAVLAGLVTTAEELPRAVISSVTPHPATVPAGGTVPADATAVTSVARRQLNVAATQLNVAGVQSTLAVQSSTRPSLAALPPGTSARTVTLNVATATSTVPAHCENPLRQTITGGATAAGSVTGNAPKRTAAANASARASGAEHGQQ